MASDKPATSRPHAAHPPPRHGLPQRPHARRAAGAHRRRRRKAGKLLLPAIRPARQRPAADGRPDHRHLARGLALRSGRGGLRPLLPRNEGAAPLLPDAVLGGRERGQGTALRLPRRAHHRHPGHPEERRRPVHHGPSLRDPAPAGPVLDEGRHRGAPRLGGGIDRQQLPVSAGPGRGGLPLLPRRDNHRDGLPDMALLPDDPDPCSRNISRV